MLPSQQDPDAEPTTPTDEQDDVQPAEKQVSEVGAMSSDDGPQVTAPEDATAGYPDSESGGAQEGEAGPNAAPHHDSPRSGASGTGTDRG